MKKFFLIFLSFIISLTACSSEIPQAQESTTAVKEKAPTEYYKAVWFTYYEIQNMMSDDIRTFEKNVNNAFSKVSDMGFNTVIIHIRPCADAFYKSKYFPTSEYCTKKQGDDLLFDPLGVMCSIAREKGLKTEAWINPYRVSLNGDIEKLCDTNIAKKWYKDDVTKSNVFVSKNGIYFNPACKEVEELIVNGVREVVENYDIDAVHFDDYFYPTTDKKIDSREYEKYIKSGGDKKLGAWRRDNVSSLIKSVYSAVKKAKSDVRFGISPASNIDDDFHKLYADVEKWVSSKGYVDYICPQIYFGFRNVYQPFMFTTKKWVGITSSCKLYVGLPLYKCGRVDKYAAKNDKSIKKEFVENDDIIARQIIYLSKIDAVEGYSVFSYSSLSDEKCKSSVEKMLTAMQNSSHQ